MSGTASVPPVRLKSAEFRRERERGWLELEALLARVGRSGITSLEAAELERLPLLYRAALSSLSVARAIALDRGLLLYLEDLSLRAYLAVYGPRASLAEALGEFFSRRLPDSVWAARRYLLVAALALAAGIGVGFALTVGDESWFATFVPAGMAGGRGPASTREELLRQEIAAPAAGLADSLLVMANFLFRHNTMIGILTFSLGIVAGLPTLLLTLYQGLGLGAFLALHYNRGLLWEVIGWISIHGVTELGAVVLCAAGGLAIAGRMLFPGRLSRRESLARCADEVTPIAIGAMAMFFVAALIEGGLRQVVQDTWLRLGIGFGVGALWAVYFFRPPRGAGR